MKSIFLLICVTTAVSAGQFHYIEKRSEKCILPPYPENGCYVDTRHLSAKPGYEIDSASLYVYCHQGHSMTGSNVVTCSQGFWSSTMPRCDRCCKLDPNPSVHYYCLDSIDVEGGRACNTLEPSGTIVRPECKIPNYYSDVTPLPFMRCINGSWNYVAVCTPECGRVTPEGVPLIINGTVAKRGELPWHAGIYRKTTKPYMQICGGSLVTDTVVISAAHCFWNDVWKKQPAFDYAVALGKIYRPWNNPRDEGAVKSDVKDIKIPNRFQGSATNFQDDIAILILKTVIVYHTNIRPVCLNFNFNFENIRLQPDNHLGKVAGWGLTSANGIASQILLVAKLPYVNIEQCLAISPLSFREYITSDKICAGYTNGTALCKGDSGGGLAFPDTDRYYLWGIVSTSPNNGDLCNTNALTTFTQILKHERFIKQHIPIAAGKCILPPYPKHGLYVVANAPYAIPGQDFKSVLLNVTCDQGYDVLGENVIFCQDGTWLDPIPKCVLDRSRYCNLDKHPSVQYYCTASDTAERQICDTLLPAETLVEPECNSPGYYSPTFLPYMKCMNGNWTYIAICSTDCGQLPPQTAPLILGGTPPPRSEVPWHAGIYRKTTNPYMQICGGSLVSNTIVISAANCFWNEAKLQPASDYAVALGKINRAWDYPGDDNAVKSDVKEIKVPSSFQGQFKDDIAVVILQNSIIYRDYIRPVCLDFDYIFESRQLQPGNLGKVSGWGLTAAKGTESEILQVLSLPYVDIQQCIKMSPIGFRDNFTGDDKLCARHINGTVCKGDDGAGLAFPELERSGTHRYYLRGVLSSAPRNEDSCNDYEMAAFTHIWKHEEFVEQYL